MTTRLSRARRALTSLLAATAVVTATLSLTQVAPAQAGSHRQRGHHQSAHGHGKNGHHGQHPQHTQHGHRRHFRPANGPMFNNPMGTWDQQERLMRHVMAAVNHAKPGSTIRIALYSFNRKDFVVSLQKACDRGVTVQMVLNDNTITAQIRHMRQYLGTKLKPHFADKCHPRKRKKGAHPYPRPSFFIVCQQACRTNSRIGNQHDKFYLFSHTGRARHVIMVGSNNLTSYASHVHWNELFTLSERKNMYRDYSSVFVQLARNQAVQSPFEAFINGSLYSTFGPENHAIGTSDPVAQRLSQISCKAMPGSGFHGHTVIHVAMYAWVGTRGIYLANRFAQLVQRGCRVKAILSGAGYRVAHILKRAGARIRSADLNTDHDLDTGFEDTPWEHFTHEKWMVLNGTYAHAPAQIVWTGSENWANKSLYNDEVTLEIPWKRAVREYVTHFDYVWSHHTRAFAGPAMRQLLDPRLRPSEASNE